jgi:hypothetical protein
MYDKLYNKRIDWRPIVAANKEHFINKNIDNMKNSYNNMDYNIRKSNNSSALGST